MNSQNDKQLDYELKKLPPVNVKSADANPDEKKVPFWSVNPNVLFQHEYMLEFFPVETMTYEQKLNAIVANACHWVNNINQYADNIAQDVEHNFHLMTELAQKNTAILQQFVADHSLNCDIEEVVTFEDTSDYKLRYLNSDRTPATADELFEGWYNNIKDPSWPSCGSENNFSTLPKWIQQECIEVFGYKKS